MKIKNIAWNSFLIVAVGAAAALAQNPCGAGLPDDAIYKFDQFPGIILTQPNLIDGAPNFREIGTDPVYGVGQPTVAALRQVLSSVEGGSGRPIFWINLRREPFLYINGKPYVLRDKNHPFQNLTTGPADLAGLEAAEQCLEKNLASQAAENGGMVDLYDESASGQLIGGQAKLGSVETVSGVYADMKAEGYPVDFVRMPLQDQVAPTPVDLAALLAAFNLKAADENLVLNCQQGKFRTTIALAVYYVGQGLDADAALDKVGALMNFRTAAATEKNPQKQAVYQAIYGELASLHASLSTQPSPDPRQGALLERKALGLGLQMAQAL